MRNAIRRLKSHPGLSIVQTRVIVSVGVLLLARFTSAFENPAQVSWIISGYALLNLVLVLVLGSWLKQKRVRMVPILLDLAAISFLVTVTGGLESSWFVLYLFPVLSASRYLGPGWTGAIAVLAIFAYAFASFVLAKDGVPDTAFWLRVLTLAGAAFTAANLARTRDRSEARLVEAIERIDREILGDTELERVMRSILDAAMELTDSDLSAIVLVEGERMTASFAATNPAEKEAPKARQDEEEARHLVQRHYRQVLSSRRPLTLPASRARALAAALTRSGNKADRWPARLVPLEIDQTHFGVLAIFSRRSLHYYTPNDREKLSSMASLVAMAHKNAQLFRELAARQEESVRRLQILYEIGGQLKAEQGLDQLFRSVVALVSNRLGSEEAALFLADERGTRIEKVAEAGPDEEIGKTLTGIERSYKKGESLSGTVFASKRPLLLNNIDSTAVDYARDYSEKLPSKMTRDYMGAPLLIGEEVLGVIRVLNKKAEDYTFQTDAAKLAPEGFSEDDLQLLSLIATQVASAIRNAKFIERTRYFSELVYNTPNAMIIIDKHGKVQNFNRECEKIWGFREQDVWGRPVEDLYESLAHAKEIGHALWAARDQGYTIRDYQARIKNRKGEIIPIRLSATLLVDKDGNKLGSMSVFQDERELVRLEEEKMRAEKLAAFGRLAQTTGHDIKHDIGAIQTFLKPLERSDRDNRERMQVYSAIRTATTEALSKLQNMLMIAGPRPPAKKVVDIKSELAEFEERIRYRVSVTKIDFRSKYPECNPLVLGDPSQLRHVLSNLFGNSLDAIRAARRSTDGNGRQAGRIDLTLEVQDETLLLSWSDDGCGMPEETRRKAFTAFFTTKKTGNGLGLYLTKTIIENHNGHIAIEPGEGAGVRFRIELPLFHAPDNPSSKVS